MKRMQHFAAFLMVILLFCSSVTCYAAESEITICFTGDISLADDAVTTKQLESQKGDLLACISPELIKEMQNADLTVVNNEFAYSQKGEPLPNKMYTFRADPSRVVILQDMGVDIAGLANNHVYDYGKTAFLDTLDTLEGAGILYTGAGRDLAHAAAPVYRQVGDKVIAFVAASRAEKYKMTPQATEKEPGILRCYDNSLFLQEIREAKQNADYVVALVHWGTEYSTKLEEVQRKTGKEYIDAGADLIIGSHSHCLQGIEFYQGKPIYYSLGNFWFNDKTLDTMLVKLTLTKKDGHLEAETQIIPALQSGAKTVYLPEGTERTNLLNKLRKISVNSVIEENGTVKEKQ